MKDLIKNLLDALKGTNGPTRVVIGAAIALVLVVAGFASFQAANPHFVLLDMQPDSTQLAGVQAAIANKGIRFKTSLPPGPFSIWVEESREYEARNAVAIEGAMSESPRGIDTKTGGASAVFMGAMERTQQSFKRKWQETEKQLEAYRWIRTARVTSSMPTKVLGRGEPPTVAVVLELQGLLEPSRAQCDSVATIVRAAFGVPADNVTISDHHGTVLYDGTADRGLDELIEFENRYDRMATERVQRMLDDSYGHGLATVSVKHSWNHDQTESVDEAVDPTKVTISKMESGTETPQTTNSVGGPAGTASNLVDLNSTDGSSESTGAVATTTELREDYAIGRRTTHKRQDSPVLERLSVTLLLDESIADELPSAEAWVKNAVGFDLARGDSFAGTAAKFSALERDENGLPLAPEPLPVPESTNPLLELALERGVEIVAALAFLVMLMKSIKTSKKKTNEAIAGMQAGQRDAEQEPEVDLELLARRHVEELLETDPARVGELLSKWASEPASTGVEA